MNKEKFQHDNKKQHSFQNQGAKPQWSGQHSNESLKQNPSKHQWPGQKDKR